MEIVRVRVENGRAAAGLSKCLSIARLTALEIGCCTSVCSSLRLIRSSMSESEMGMRRQAPRTVTGLRVEALAGIGSALTASSVCEVSWAVEFSIAMCSRNSSSVAYSST